MTGRAVLARVASEIEIDVEQLPATALDLIKAALTFQNEDREKQAALNIFGWWEMPESITLWRVEQRRGGQTVLCLPRGFMHQLHTGLSGIGLTLQVDDQRSRASSAPGYFIPFPLRDYQVRFVSDLLAAQQGVGSQPAGAGKTMCALGLMSYAQQRTLVIVDRAALLEQWRSRAAKFMGLSLDYDDERSVGKIGEDVWQERDLTVALRQTLFSRLWEVKAVDWFSKFGIVVLDECQHLSSSTLQSVLAEVSSRMVFGISATPARTPMQGQILNALVGPIVAETPRQILYDAKVLMKPSIRTIYTDLEVDFWPDHKVGHGETCKVPNCKKSSPHSHRNNYQSCLKKFVESDYRNKLIAESIVAERGHVHLVPSRQLKHLDLIKKALVEVGWDGPIFMLRGEENARGESQEIIEAAENSHEAVILSTVADEGLDIPPIDRVWLTFPMRQSAAVVQVVGRCERVAEGKTDAVVVDLHDHLVSVFADQARERQATYRMQGYNSEPETPVETEVQVEVEESTNVITPPPRPEEMLGFFVDHERGIVRYSCPCGAGWSAPHGGCDPKAGSSLRCLECQESRLLIRDS